jgi:hypothetical protein
MTIDQKNLYRLRIRLAFVTQWMLVTTVILVGMFAGISMAHVGELLTASTTALTTALGLDYFSKPSDPEVK